ncbi:MAG TPA: hypothetical protein VF742_00065, partial [Terracidiphilus sp.]
MSWQIKNSAQRRYIVRSAISAGMLIVFSFAGKRALHTLHPSTVMAYLIGFAAALPIVGAVAATAYYVLEEKDEFQMNIFVQSLLVGMAFTLALTTIWGYLENFARAPHLDPIWLYAIFWLFVGVATPFLRARYNTPSQEHPA